MKVKVIFNEGSIKENKHKFINNFIKFLYENYPLKNDLVITFVAKRVGRMTTGSRNSKSEIKILAKNRMIRDILRSLAHEWVHEYQINIMGREIGGDIGGINEDEANYIAGRLIKIFEKKYPHQEYIMYE